MISALSSQSIGVLIVCWTVYSGADQKNIKAPRHWPLWRNPPVTGGFPSQRASNAKSVSIWWHHHGILSPSPPIATATKIRIKLIWQVLKGCITSSAHNSERVQYSIRLFGFFWWTRFLAHVSGIPQWTIACLHLRLLHSSSHTHARRKCHSWLCPTKVASWLQNLVFLQLYILHFHVQCAPDISMALFFN